MLLVRGVLLGLVPARGTSVTLHTIEPNTNVSAASIFDTASCASSNNSSVTRKRSAAMPKLMSATCMAGARAKSIFELVFTWASGSFPHGFAHGVPRKVERAFE